MTETVFRLRIIPNRGSSKPLFADITKTNYELLVQQSKAKPTFKVYIVRTLFTKKVGFTPMKKIKKYITENQIQPTE